MNGLNPNYLAGGVMIFVAIMDIILATTILPKTLKGTPEKNAFVLKSIKVLALLFGITGIALIAFAK